MRNSLLTLLLAALSCVTVSAATSQGSFLSANTSSEEETVWDFSGLGTTNLLKEDNSRTYEYGELICKGLNSSDILNVNGFQMNGNSSTSGRYISFTPTVDGTWTVYYKTPQTSTSHITAIGTQITLGTSLTVGENGVLAYGYTNSSEVLSISAVLTANTTYYTYFASGKQTITKLVFTPTSLATAHSVTLDTQSKGTCTVATLTESSAGNGVTLPTVTQGEGYVFLGWATSKGTATPTYSAGDTYYPSVDQTIYAIYRDSLILELTDGEDYTATEDTEYEKVTFTKTISSSQAGHWAALYVPFAINVADYTSQMDIAEIYSFAPIRDTNDDGVVDSNDDVVLMLNLLTTGTTVPNLPYLIRVKKAGTVTISASDGKTYAATSGSIDTYTTKAKYTVTGINEAVTATPDNGYYYMAVSGKLSYRTTGSATIKANRWYLTIDSDDAYTADAKPASIGLFVIGEDEEEVTAVTTVNADAPTSDDDIYTLDGRRITGKPQPGLYIKNNKKVIIR